MTTTMTMSHVDKHIRPPDFIDTVSETACWFNTDAAIEVPLSLIGSMARLTESAGWHARSGHELSKFGITLSTHGPNFLHPSIDAENMSEANVRRASWAMLTDVLSSGLSWMLPKEIALAAELDLDALANES